MVADASSDSRRRYRSGNASVGPRYSCLSSGWHTVAICPVSPPATVMVTAVPVRDTTMEAPIAASRCSRTITDGDAAEEAEVGIEVAGERGDKAGSRREHRKTGGKDA